LMYKPVRNSDVKQVVIECRNSTSRELLK
jgi:hypothetical protein